MAVSGVFIGAFCVYLGGQGAAVRAERTMLAAPPLRDAVLPGPASAFAARARYVEQLIDRSAQAGFGQSGFKLRSEQRLNPPVFVQDRPKIIIIFDDMGVDKSAFNAVMNLPGPVTLSFLPYADDIQRQVDRARGRGDAIMLHLPMEPVSDIDPGPRALTRSMTGTELLSTLSWNLDQFGGYIGVNNHMGSAFTSDLAVMKTVLSVLKAEGVFFLDSLTTSKSAVTKAGLSVDLPIFRRDVFLDPDKDRATIFRQLELVERIALETGYVVAICHPRKETIDVLGPWLTSAPARGFELATVQTLVEVDEKLRKRDQAKTTG